MNFIKNPTHPNQNDDSKDQTTEDHVSHNINTDDIQGPTDIQELLTSQSSDEINDFFAKEFDLSPDNPNDTEISVIKDVREKNIEIVSNSSLTNISIDAVNNNAAENVLSEEPVLNLDDFFEVFDEISNFVDVNVINEKLELNEKETRATTNNTEVPISISDDFDKTSTEVSENVDVNDRKERDKLKGKNTPVNDKNVDEPVLNKCCDETLSEIRKLEKLKENPTSDNNNEEPDINLININYNFDKTFEVSKTVDRNQYISRQKENCSLEQPMLDIDEFEIFGSYDASDENKNLLSENNNTEQMRVVTENMDIKTESEICFGEFEDIFKFFDTKAAEKVHDVENPQPPNLDETIEDTKTYATMTEVPCNITLTQSEVGHSLNNINTTNEKLTMPNYIDFEAELEKSVILKGNNSDSINKTVKENQPIVIDELEQVNDIDLLDSNENNIHFDDVIDLSDSSSNDSDIISISSTENGPNDNKNNDSDYCSGYNSSDFEFIDEEEAKLGGIVINCYNQELGTPKRSKIVHTLEIAKDPSYVSGSSPESIELPNRSGPSNARENSQKDSRSGSSNAKDDSQKYNRPCPSNARDNSQGDNKSGPSNATHNYQHYRSNVYFDPVDTNYRQNHVIPEGEEYNNLFQGIYAPFLSELHFLENKSIRPVSCMNTQFRNIGFDTIGVRREESDNEFKDEAEENAEKIRSMYPGENRKRRRRI